MAEELSVYITARKVRNRYGGVSHMWLERRLKDDPMFPRPTYLGGRRFWQVAELEAWERSSASKSTK